MDISIDYLVGVVLFLYPTLYGLLLKYFTFSVEMHINIHHQKLHQFALETGILAFLLIELIEHFII